MNRDEIENFEGYQSASEKGTALFFPRYWFKMYWFMF